MVIFFGTLSASPLWTTTFTVYRVPAVKLVNWTGLTWLSLILSTGSLPCPMLNIYLSKTPLSFGAVYFTLKVVGVVDNSVSSNEPKEGSERKTS